MLLFLLHFGAHGLQQNDNKNLEAEEELGEGEEEAGRRVPTQVEKCLKEEGRWVSGLSFKKILQEDDSFFSCEGTVRNLFFSMVMPCSDLRFPNCGGTAVSWLLSRES